MYTVNTFRRYRTITALACTAALGFYSMATPQAFANEEVISHTASAVASSIDRAGAKSRLPMLTDLSQLPPEVLKTIGASDSGVESQGYGALGHPFTTKRAGAQGRSAQPMKSFPWRATGKLWMRFNTDWSVCTASVIGKNLLVTAAHCVHNFGQAASGFADEVIFEPARHRGGSTCTSKTCPYGEWLAPYIYIPAVYWDGTDVCTTSGVICENDVAVLVVNQLNGKNIQNVTGKYNYKSNNYGYKSFLGEMATQITQFGYPVAHDSGYRMIRTDSLGYQATPNNVVIGSDQTGGSSGGPWIQNFGISSSSTSSAPTANLSNTVVATTSWGYTDSTQKVQGASRFAKNTNFTTRSNIDALVNDACTDHPTSC